MNLYKIWAFGYPFEASERAVIKKGKDSFYVMSAHKQNQNFKILLSYWSRSRFKFDFLFFTRHDEEKDTFKLGTSLVPECKRRSHERNRENEFPVTARTKLQHTHITFHFICP